MAKKTANRRSCSGPPPSQKWRATERTAAAAATTTISELPVDIISDILLRLHDIKSIIKCRQVCKAWRDLIFQLYYTQSQLSRGSFPRSLIFHRRSKGPLNPSHFGILELNDPTYLRRRNATMKFTSEIFLLHKYSRVRVLGACNGLICLHVNGDIVVYNPIHQGRRPFILPKCATKDGGLLSLGREWTAGFGYSSVSDKYKVIRCARTAIGWNTIEFVICTLGSDDAWRSLRGHKGQLFPERYFYNTDSVFVKGTLHWLGRGTNSMWLHRFDVENEELKILPLPFEINGPSLKLGADNHLCLTEWCPNNHINVWVMNDYQYMGSWTKKWTIKVSYSRGLYLSIQLVKIWKDGTMLMIFHDKSLGVYDPQTGVLESVKCYGDPFWPAEMTYTPSFVSPPWML